MEDKETITFIKKNFIQASFAVGITLLSTMFIMFGGMIVLQVQMSYVSKTLDKIEENSKDRWTKSDHDRYVVEVKEQFIKHLNDSSEKFKDIRSRVYNLERKAKR